MNLKSSEILVDLREAVSQVARHFINVDPKLNNIMLIADYTMESHAKDHDNYVNVSRTRKRRAKALLGLNTHNFYRYILGYLSGYNFTIMVIILRC